MTARKIPIRDLGTALGVTKIGGARQARQDRFYSFRGNLLKDRVLLNDLAKIAKIFELPMEYFLLSDRQFTALQEPSARNDLHVTQQGTYLFIHKDDHDLLDRLFEKVGRV